MTPRNFLSEATSSDSKTLAVIIPTFDSERTIGQCIESILQQSIPASLILVIDGGSADATLSIARTYEVDYVVCSPNRSAQRNEGARLAPVDYLLFIDSDMRLSTDVIKMCVGAFRQGVVALRLPEVDVGTSFWSKVRGFERTLMKDVDWTKAARCFRRSEFISIKGFDVGLVGFEDWDVDERIREHGQVEDIDAYVEHDEGKVTFMGLMRKKGHYSQSISVFRERHPDRARKSLSGVLRARAILCQPSQLFVHPLLSLGLGAVGVAELLISRVHFFTSRISSQEVPLAENQNPLAN